MARFRSRLPASLYVAGPFAMGYTEFYNFLIPLYGLSLGMSAGQIGMLVGARSLLAVFLSIHVGALMDRLVHLSYGLSVILGFIGVKMVFEALHGSGVEHVGPVTVPTIGIAASLGVIIGVLAITTVTSLWSTRRAQAEDGPAQESEEGTEGESEELPEQQPQG